MASKMKLIPCGEPETTDYPAEQCPKCHRFMRSNGKGCWYCSNCGKWWRETAVVSTDGREGTNNLSTKSPEDEEPK